ncbi:MULTISPECIES: isocitrate/isopropylmalate family dehydrogenase [Thermococcus]|uniref:3-isopropylmalate dehydrogenase n=1 Tax=Thermococcus sibiricus TaxID=172049 RepID=A0A101EM62_9EURY|nr:MULTISPECIES: isocitrate/isopropylmalate family dehydrogenase [Thermococcus]KUK17928.1 MAG: 3-isopropylmalate dehydrogenase [Thermococcus sibiricus]KUK29331.1 MAG: 3-isopropylmalate dehydrogenase [Thermococcus sp. 40_45]MBC7094635.1 3-isopropylmalate dehydrogenase [Thermococcus sp.]HII67887.1 3-isopropylmalate dehydrogenase [Thermococcaceae archaeon]
MHRVAVIKGDGIGVEVTEAAMKVIGAVTDKIEFVEFEGGVEVFKKFGTPIREEDLEEIRKMDAVLFGATTTSFDVPNYKSLIITLRKELNLYANLRIIPDLWRDREIYIVRENSEGLYSGVYRTTNERAIDFRIITREGAERIARFAIELAKDKSFDEITFVHKANVLRSDRFFREIVLDLAEREGIRVNEKIVDSFSIELVRNPWQHKLILSENLFGDILSDLASIHARSIGVVPSGNYGEEIALFEPIHGSAPDIAGKGIANPIGAILSGAMLLDYLGLDGGVIWNAVKSYVKKGNLTPDLGGNGMTADVVNGIISEIDDQEIDPIEWDEVWVEEIRINTIPMLFMK